MCMFIKNQIVHNNVCLFVCLFVCSVSGSDICDVCSKNARIAAQCGRTDLVQAWTTAALIAEMGLHPPVTASNMPWPRHPFGRNLIKSL